MPTLADQTSAKAVPQRVTYSRCVSVPPSTSVTTSREERPRHRSMAALTSATKSARAAVKDRRVGYKGAKYEGKSLHRSLFFGKLRRSLESKEENGGEDVEGLAHHHPHSGSQPIPVRKSDSLERELSGRVAKESPDPLDGGTSSGSPKGNTLQFLPV